MNRKTPPYFFPCVILFFAISISAWAQTPVTWANLGTDWATGTNWIGDAAPSNDLTNNIAEFGGTTVVPTLATNRSINGLLFNAAATYTLSNTTAGTLLSVGSSGLNFGDNAATLNVGNAATFNTYFVLGATGIDSGVTTGAGAVSIRANPSGAANQTLFRIAAGRTATFNVGTGGLSIGGANTRDFVIFNNTAATLLKTGPGILSIANGAVGTPQGPNGNWDISQGTASLDPNVSIFGTSAITLGDTNGSATARLEIQRVGTFSNNLTVRSGSTGAKTFAVRFQSQALAGALTLNDALDLVVRANSNSTVTVTNNMVIGGASTLAFKAENAVNTNTATGITILGGANTGFTGSVTVGNATNDGGLTASVLQLGGASALPASNNVTVNHQGTFRLGGNSVTLGWLAGGGTSSFVENASAAPATLTLSVGGTVDTNYAGVVRDGSGGGALSLVKSGTGTNRLTGANSFSGSVSITGGELIVSHTALGATNAVDVSAGASFKTAMSSNTLTIGPLTGTGRVRGSLGAGANAVLVLNVASGSPVFSGVIDQEFSGTYAIHKTGGGTQTFASTSSNAYTGPTLVAGGTLIVNGSLASTSAVTVSPGATLAGTGMAGAVTVNGTFAPGATSTNGTFTVTSTLNVPGTAQFRVFGNNINDKVIVSGGATLSGTVSVATNYTPVNGDTFDLVDGTISNAPVLSLPPLGGGLTWVTNAFLSTGVLSVTDGSVTPYNAWVSYWQTNSAGFTNTARTANPDGDPYDNNMEFAFDGNPTIGSPALLTAVKVGTNAVFNYVALTNTNAATYAVQSTTNLSAGPWTNAAVTISNSTNQGGISQTNNYLRKEFVVPATAAGFYRVKAAIAP